MEGSKAVTDENVELASMKEALRWLEGRASADRLATHCAMEDCNCVLGKVVTFSAKLKVAKRALTLTFDHLIRHCSEVQAAEAVVQESMKSNLRSYVQTNFDQVKHSPWAYHLNVDGDISSLATGLTQDTRSMCARYTKHPDRVRRRVSDPGEGTSSQ